MTRSGQTLKKARTLFSTWRRNRKSRRERIPEELWDVAVNATSERGVAAAAKELSLGYVDLKRRVEKAQKVSKTEVTGKGFVEIPVIPEMIRHGHGSAIVEITNPRGFRMSVRSDDGGMVDVVRVIQSFMEVGQ